MTVEKKQRGSRARTSVSLRSVAQLATDGRTGGRHFRTSQKYNHVFGQQQEEDLRSVIAAGTGVGAITADA